METAGFFKGTAWGLFVLGIIGAIILGVNLGIVAFLSCALSVFILCIIIYGIGAIIELLDGICTNTYNMYYAYYKINSGDKK